MSDDRAMDEQLPTISPADVPSRTQDGWAVVDVRTDAEWADGRIEGSLHIPLDQVMERVNEIPDPAVVVCASGRRSAQATAYLLDQGRQAVNLDGGLHAWEDDGRPLTR